MMVNYMHIYSKLFAKLLACTFALLEVPKKTKIASNFENEMSE